jgi:hypothetical protein
LPIIVVVPNGLNAAAAKTLVGLDAMIRYLTHAMPKRVAFQEVIGLVRGTSERPNVYSTLRMIPVWPSLVRAFNLIAV